MHKNIILLFTFLILFNVDLRASHAMGGELTYKWLDSTSVEFTFRFYRDCYGIAAPSSVTVNGASAICGDSTSFVLNLDTFKVVPNVCPNVTTTCSGGVYQGMEEYYYSGVVNVAQLACPDWEFTYILCCRNDAITTLQNASTESLYLRTTFNGQNGGINSSPVFNTPPYFSLYNNTTYNLDFSAKDYDGDSLSYKLVNPLTSHGGAIAYYPPYTAQNPFNSPNFSLNALTGELTVQTNAVLVTVISIEVEEWRNGLLVGTIMRDIQIMVSATNATNSQPSISGINGTSDEVLYACLGDTIDFDLFATDPDIGDSLEVNIIQGINGSNVTASNVPNPTINFNWVPTVLDVNGEPQFFQIQVKDQACPFQNMSYKTLTIYVNNCDTANVWPGDTDNDFKVDVFDMVPIAIGMGTQGHVRPNASILWTAQPSNNWGPTMPNSLDYKHADCDGDGLIDTMDIAAILVNYGQIHPKPVKDPTIVNYFTKVNRNSVDLILDTTYIMGPNNEIFIPVILGDSATTVGDVLALAFSLDYDASKIVSGSIDFIPNNCLGVLGQDLYSMSYDLPMIGQLDVGVIRTNNVGIDTSGVVGHLKLQINGSSQQLPFNISNSALVNAQTAEIPLQTSAMTLNINLGSSNGLEPLELKAYPNPIHDYVIIRGALKGASYMIYALDGSVMSSGILTQSIENKLSTDFLAKGVYQMKINLAGDTRNVKLVKY